MARQPLTYRVAFSTPWFEIEESIPGSVGELPYYRMTGPNGVICLPFTPEGDVVLVRQFRPNLGVETIEAPAGSIDGDETVEQAIERELIEETGFRPGQMFLLGPGRLHMNRTTHVESFLLALDVVADPTLTVEDGVVPLVVPRDEFMGLIRADKIEQIAILSFLGLASVKLGVDLMRDPIQLIRERVDQERRRGMQIGQSQRAAAVRQ